MTFFSMLLAAIFMSQAKDVKPKLKFPPTVDISKQTERQVIVAQGTEEIYQGHPTTILLPDQKTIYCVWTLGHGGPAGPMKRSDDGGLTWSDLLKVPDSWKQTKNCPTIWRLRDGSGKARLFVFTATGPTDEMHESHSEDEGKSWTDMKGIALTTIMPFTTIEPIDGGKKLLGMTNTLRPGERFEKNSNVVAQSISSDGGLTWTPFRIVSDIPGLKPCEPWLVRSPDGKQLLCLMRENLKHASLYMTSEDEGTTWSDAKPLPPGLYGDRHVAKYSQDGRLVITMRDMGQMYGSPIAPHFIAWVGHYEDIITGRDGQYRIKLLHSFAGKDNGYAGLELLPDGTFVATTYIKYREGKEKHSVVSTRFNLKETDQLAESIKP